MSEAATGLAHVLALGEVLWGIALIAVTMVIHAVGMPITLSVANGLWRRSPRRAGLHRGAPVLVLASWMIVFVHLVEVTVWAGFLVWRGAMPAAADAFYFTLCQYVTVGSALSLPERWRLVGGMIAMAGLLTFAWSTAVLLSLAQKCENAWLAEHDRSGRGGAPGGSAGDRKHHG